VKLRRLAVDTTDEALNQSGVILELGCRIDRIKKIKKKVEGRGQIHCATRKGQNKVEWKSSTYNQRRLILDFMEAQRTKTLSRSPDSCESLRQLLECWLVLSQTISISNQHNLENLAAHNQHQHQQRNIYFRMLYCTQ